MLPLPPALGAKVWRTGLGATLLGAALLLQRRVALGAKLLRSRLVLALCDLAVARCLLHYENAA